MKVGLVSPTSSVYLICFCLLCSTLATTGAGRASIGTPGGRRRCDLLSAHAFDFNVLDLLVIQTPVHWLLKLYYTTQHGGVQALFDAVVNTSTALPLRFKQHAQRPVLVIGTHIHNGYCVRHDKTLAIRFLQ